MQSNALYLTLFSLFIAVLLYVFISQVISINGPLEQLLAFMIPGGTVAGIAFYVFKGQKK